MENGLRQRKRRMTMNRVQDAAYRLAARGGFDAVTVEEIAAAADTSPATIYRAFGTKESIFLWDPFEEPFLGAISRALHTGAEPFAAVRSGVTEVMAAVEATAEPRFQEMIRFVYGDDRLREAAWVRMRLLAPDLGAELVEAGVGELDAAVLALATVGALWAALEAWQRPESRGSLPAIFDGAIASLGCLRDLRRG